MWARVLTSDKVAVSRLGGDLHRDGFEIRPDVQPDVDGTYSLYAQWNPGERTTTVVRPGAGEPAPISTLLDDALAHLLSATVASTRSHDEAEVEDVLTATRQQIKVLFSGSDAPRRYLQAVVSPQA